MSTIIACIDGSPHADSVAQMAAWAAKQLAAPITLLHVAPPHSEMHATTDASGAIGLGAKSELLAKLTELDAQHGKLEQQKGKLMLAHAEELLSEQHSGQVERLHRRGSLLETLQELPAALVVLGKRGEQAMRDPDHLGSNLERVARGITVPLLVVPEASPVTINRFMIAFDGSASSDAIIAYLTKQPLLKGAECHLLTVGDKAREAAETAKGQLQQAGYAVTLHLSETESVRRSVADCVAAQQIDLLVMGAYGHSKLRHLVLGSTTTALLQQTEIPLLLFR